MDELTNRSCPHCGAEVPALPECLRCGIVFAKYRSSPRPTSTVEVTASRPDSRPLAPWLAVLGLVIALASVGYNWFENASGFRSGLELAVAESRPIAVYFYTDWCGYCRQFERELLTRARVEDFTKYLVKVRINPESGLRERAIARQYGVRGYPSFFVQASAEARPHKIRQHKRVGGDWVLQTPSDFVTTLKRAIG